MGMSRAAVASEVVRAHLAGPESGIAVVHVKRFPLLSLVLSAHSGTYHLQTLWPPPARVPPKVFAPARHMLPHPTHYKSDQLELAATARGLLRTAAPPPALASCWPTASRCLLLPCPLLAAPLSPWAWAYRPQLQDALLVLRHLLECGNAWTL